MWSMIAFFFLFFLTYAFFVSSHAALRKNYMSKDTGDLSSTPVSDNKLCYTPEWDDDVHPHQFHMGFSPGVHGRGNIWSGNWVNYKFFLPVLLVYASKSKGEFNIWSKVT